MTLPVTPSAHGSNATTEIRISLFGQPCLLRGPQDERTLQKIHSISPEQLEPPASVEMARKNLGKIRSTSNLPSLLDSYRERQAKRLDAQASFFLALEESSKSGKRGPLIAVGKKYLKIPKARKPFEDAVKKVKLRDKEISAQLLDLFNEGIEPDPQEDFHRAAKQLNIQYVCSFEEDPSEEESSSSPEPSST